DPSNMGNVCDSPSGVHATVGNVPGPTVTAPVVEYYNAALDHYFLTQAGAEIADLDSAVHSGWTRTGQSFLAWRSGQSDGRGMAVVRYYGLPSRGLDTHFFTASWGEVRSFIGSSYFSDWQQETLDAFELALP